MVGVTGLEPATSRPPDGRATRLRYTPTGHVLSCGHLNVKALAAHQFRNEKPVHTAFIAQIMRQGADITFGR